MLLVGAALQPSGGSIGRRTILDGDAGERLDRHLTQLADRGFAGVVLVARSANVLLHKGYGTADRQRATPIGVETVFDIGSITKQFTAAAILKLEVEGKLRTADPIERHLPDVPPDKRAITIHHL
jgi:CubicO group peptidase (beta-lactamase class C family)